MYIYRYSVLFTLVILSLISHGCEQQNKVDFPILGEVTQDFSFTNQDNETVTNATFENKIYVTDFFFTTCPSICPVMKRQMHRVYEAIKTVPDIVLLSHTIDPEHDTVQILSQYANGLGIDAAKWHLVTGDQDAIFAMAKHYMLGVMKNEEVPGGYLHSGSFVLVDKDKKIRGYYNGTKQEEVDELIEDLKMMVNND